VSLGPQYCTLDCTTQQTRIKHSNMYSTVYYWLTQYQKNALTRYPECTPVHWIARTYTVLYHNDALSQYLHTDHISLDIPRRWERTTNPYTMCTIVLVYCTLLYNMTLLYSEYWSIEYLYSSTVQRTHRRTNHDQRGFFCFPTNSGVLRAWIYFILQYAVPQSSHTP
jgi:hypothetical protein